MLHDYPIDLVLNLHRAAMENQKAELKSRVLGFSVAVMNALDLALGSGKGAILENWLKAVDGPADRPEPEAKPRRPKLSPAAVAFFSGLPAKSKKG